jgi:hypothetical protein
LALVINQFGFIKYSAVLRGNVSDPATLDAMLKDLRSKTSDSAKTALVVIDAGIATEENLAKIRSEGFHYLCVSRSKLKDYEMVSGSAPLTVEDNRKRKIKLQKVMPANASGEGGAYYLKVESEQKKKKEVSMNDRFRDGYLNGLKSISASLSKKRGTKLESKVHERVGRLMQKYPSIHKYYQMVGEHCRTIDYQIEEKSTGKGKKKPLQRIVTSMRWTLKPQANMDATCGVYFLRTSLDNQNRIIWDSYNIIREIEYTMRVLKTDLDTVGEPVEPCVPFFTKKMKQPYFDRLNNHGASAFGNIGILGGEHHTVSTKGAWRQPSMERNSTYNEHTENCNYNRTKQLQPNHSNQTLFRT